MFIRRETTEIKHINRVLEEEIKKYFLKLFLKLNI